MNSVPSDWEFTFGMTQPWSASCPQRVGVCRHVRLCAWVNKKAIHISYLHPRYSVYVRLQHAWRTRAVTPDLGEWESRARERERRGVGGVEAASARRQRPWLVNAVTLKALRWWKESLKKTVTHFCFAQHRDKDTPPAHKVTNVWKSNWNQSQNLHQQSPGNSRWAATHTEKHPGWLRTAYDQR